MPRFTGSRRASLSLAALAVPLLLHACGGGTEPKATAELVKVSGDGQGTLAGQALAQALVVQVNAVGGGTMSGDSVTFAVASGGGSLGTPSVVTNGGGQAQTTWTLGGTVGSQTVTATVRGAIPRRSPPPPSRHRARPTWSCSRGTTSPAWWATASTGGRRSSSPT